MVTTERRSRIRVLVVDDVPAARQMLRAALEEEPDVVVVGEAADGAEAVEMVQRLRPDVITMDVVMPVLDGYRATERIMATCPTPVVAVTSLSLDDGSVLARMLAAGAVDIVGKAFARDPRKSARMRRELVLKIRAAADAHLQALPPGRQPETPTGGSLASRARIRRPAAEPRAIVMAASTGGPAALQAVLRALPAGLPCPILIVQHIAEGFAGWLAEWLQADCGMVVQLARDGERAEAGCVYLAPSGKHLLITPEPAIRLNEALPVHSLRPSADVLFRSASQAFGSAVIGVVLTGMGTDGAEGAFRIKESGGVVLVQEPETSVIASMPQAAIAAGAADAVLPLGEIGRRLASLCGVEGR